MNEFRRRPPAPDLPPAVVPKTLKYREPQEHLLRRLGSAVVLQWDALSDAMQDLLIDQAALVEDRDRAPHDAEAIASFVRNVKVSALAKPPAAEPAGK